MLSGGQFVVLITSDRKPAHYFAFTPPLFACTSCPVRYVLAAVAPCASSSASWSYHQYAVLRRRHVRWNFCRYLMTNAAWPERICFCRLWFLSAATSRRQTKQNDSWTAWMIAVRTAATCRHQWRWWKERLSTVLMNARIWAELSAIGLSGGLCVSCLWRPLHVPVHNFRQQYFYATTQSSFQHYFNANSRRRKTNRRFRSFDVS